MNVGSITLLEIYQSAHGGRIAHCLPRGEFLFVTASATRYFRAPSASELFGRNMRDFVVPCDMEKLQDCMRAHSNCGVLSKDVASKLTMMIHLAGSGQTLWVRMKTVALSLRLLRCIDSVTVLATLTHRFADLASFVVNDDDLTAIFSLSAPAKPTSLSMNEGDCDDDVALSVSIPTDYEVPLELKSVSPFHCSDSMMSTSPASPTRMLDSFDESLSSLAFEADWATESLCTVADLVSQ